MAGDTTLDRHSAGEAGIRGIQRLFIFLGYSTTATAAFSIDGRFGRDTNRALAQFQFDQGLTDTVTRDHLTYESRWNTAASKIVAIPDTRLDIESRDHMLRYRSMSFGLGQILGVNASRVGAPSARAMFTSPVDEQVLYIARFWRPTPTSDPSRRSKNPPPTTSPSSPNATTARPTPHAATTRRSRAGSASFGGCGLGGEPFRRPAGTITPKGVAMDDWIVANPETLGGKLCLGTRISVELVLEHLGDGVSLAESLSKYPNVPREGALAALRSASDDSCSSLNSHRENLRLGYQEI